MEMSSQLRLDKETFYFVPESQITSIQQLSSSAADSQPKREVSFQPPNSTVHASSVRKNHSINYSIRTRADNCAQFRMLPSPCCSIDLPNALRCGLHLGNFDQLWRSELALKDHPRLLCNTALIAGTTSALTTS
jgi:hypothetical protein